MNLRRSVLYRGLEYFERATGWRRNASVTFAVMSYQDVEQLEWSLSKLRASYPEAALLLISDGDADPRYDSLATTHRARLLRGERLKLPQHGAAFLDRLFRSFLEKPTSFLFKIDPDTGVHRRFRFLPVADFFGTVICPGQPNEHIQGGVQGFSLRAAKALLASGLTRSDDYRDVRRWCRDAALIAHIENYQRTTGLLNVDYMTFDMMRRLGYRARPWSEVSSLWHEPTDNAGLRFAITHPCRR